MNSTEPTKSTDAVSKSEQIVTAYRAALAPGHGDALATAIRVLNEAYEADPAAMHALVCNEVPCNRELADHPHVYVSVNRVVPTPFDTLGFSVGMLGVVNGVVHALTGKYVQLRWSDKDDEGRSRCLGFEEWVKPVLPAPETKA